MCKQFRLHYDEEKKIVTRVYNYVQSFIYERHFDKNNYVL